MGFYSFWVVFCGDFLFLAFVFWASWGLCFSRLLWGTSKESSAAGSAAASSSVAKRGGDLLDLVGGLEDLRVWLFDGVISLFCCIYI